MGAARLSQWQLACRQRRLPAAGLPFGLQRHLVLIHGLVQVCPKCQRALLPGPAACCTSDAGLQRSLQTFVTGRRNVQMLSCLSGSCRCEAGLSAQWQAVTRRRMQEEVPHPTQHVRCTQHHCFAEAGHSRQGCMFACRMSSFRPVGVWAEDVGAEQLTAVGAVAAGASGRPAAGSQHAGGACPANRHPPLVQAASPQSRCASAFWSPARQGGHH